MGSIKKGAKHNTKAILLIIVLLVILIIALIYAVIKSSKNEELGDNDIYSEPNASVEQPNVIINKSEKKLSKNKQKELFDFLPKVYSEARAPFDNTFMLDAVMNKIMLSKEEEADYSTENVDNMVKQVFGEDTAIDKEKVATPDVSKSIFYYSKEAESYAAIPVGYEGRYEHQILKEATETDDAYYVYTYCLLGGYIYDENNLETNEYGVIDYENSDVQVIVGDKDGNDLVHVFDTFTSMYEDNIWISKYANKLPVFRYTLKKQNNKYILAEVEQISY